MICDCSFFHIFAKFYLHILDFIRGSLRPQKVTTSSCVEVVSAMHFLSDQML